LSKWNSFSRATARDAGNAPKSEKSETAKPVPLKKKEAAAPVNA
jgi:hypothetical protein